jgi:hypothetical protein
MKPEIEAFPREKIVSLGDSRCQRSENVGYDNLNISSFRPAQVPQDLSLMLIVVVWRGDRIQDRDGDHLEKISFH